MAKKEANAKGKKKPAAGTKGKRTRRSGFYSILGLLLLVLVFLWCLEPTQNWLRQRREMDVLTQKISALESKNKHLEEEKIALSTPEKIEAIAREEFGMVKPGEEAYVVIPPPRSAKAPIHRSEKKETTIWQRIKSYLGKL